tara:strand:+ start:3103 stop:4164 length:1062 start_codon:yes stop_codon:yes gene_type:complete
MSKENPSIQQMVEHEFMNSKNVGQSILRLSTDPPIAVVRRLVSKFIGLLVSIMDRMLELLGVSLTDPDKLYENIDKAKHNATLLTMIMIYILEDPVIRENIKQVAIALNDSALKPFLAVALITLKEMKPAIDEAEADLIERMKEGLRRAGDGATDALENVITGIPGIGNTWSAISGVTSAIQSGQAVVETNLILILETTYRILELLRKTNVPGLESVDSFIDFGLGAYNTYTNVTNKFDEINATVQQLKFDPAETLSKEKFVEALKIKDASAKAMMPNYETPEQRSGRPIVNKEIKQTPPEETPVNKEIKQTPLEQTPPETPSRTSIKKGGSRRKYNKNKKKRTRKRALKKAH